MSFSCKEFITNYNSIIKKLLAIIGFLTKSAKMETVANVCLLRTTKVRTKQPTRCRVKTFGVWE
ncbi:hypothetical protein CJ216_05745 [Gardnerella greenwoodii]|uniref:Uncharacterized protein n=1 Tax=Gardnerella greenwoodii TaxID=2914925 RepID=A0A2N6RWK9_9BIFI|nr:hypothetical protein CJ216_05745 [Gardnerella greenwoodii]